MDKKIPITIARGDGIGPEIMEATLQILKAVGAPLEICEVTIGEKVYLQGHPKGIERKTWDVIQHSRAFLKAPITTPQGKGFKSLNVTIRTTLGLYANIRPCLSYHPFVATKHPNMDLVIIRENEEDLYTGIEYKQTPQVTTALKIISSPGSERICRYAFAYAKRHGRKKVTCLVKDNILKLSDGLFHHMFQEIAKEYPEIESNHWIVDIGAAKLAATPEDFDLLVMPNLYGDILSDVAAQISGSVGLVGSANIGERGAMFEAIHGSAPRRAGQNLANPSALIHAAILMLRHLDLQESAQLMEEAWLCTIEEGIHTYDIFNEMVSKKRVGTKEFTKAVIERIGKKPATLLSTYHKGKERLALSQPSYSKTKPSPQRELVGTDLYFYSAQQAKEVEESVVGQEFGPFRVEMITNRGTQIYPDGHPDTYCVDQWRVRFLSLEKRCTQEEIIALIALLSKRGFDLIKMENLYTFDKVAGYSSPEG